MLTRAATVYLAWCDIDPRRRVLSPSILRLVGRRSQVPFAGLVPWPRASPGDVGVAGGPSRPPARGERPRPLPPARCWDAPRSPRPATRMAAVLPGASTRARAIGTGARDSGPRRRRPPTGRSLRGIDAARAGAGPRQGRRLQDTAGDGRRVRGRVPEIAAGVAVDARGDLLASGRTSPARQLRSGGPCVGPRASDPETSRPRHRGGHPGSPRAKKKDRPPGPQGPGGRRGGGRRTRRHRRSSSSRAGRRGGRSRRPGTGGQVPVVGVSGAAGLSRRGASWRGPPGR